MKHYTLLLFIILSHSNVFSQKTPKKIKSNKLYIENNQVLTKDSIPLTGHYRIKYTKYANFSNRLKKEISYFKDGFRIGNSKIFKFNKLVEEGTYANGLKHGAWRKYYHFNNKLYLTTHYVNGIKNGKEFGNYISEKYFICNYVDGVIDGPLLIYGYDNYLKSKEVYKKGELLYKYTYDDLLNITKEINFSKKNSDIIAERKVTKFKNDTYIDSFFYKNDLELAQRNYRIRRTPFKIKHFKNDTISYQKKVTIQKDTTRDGKNNYVLTFNYHDYISNQDIDISIYYNNYLVRNYQIDMFQNDLLNSTLPRYNPCYSYGVLTFNSFSNLYLYITRNKGKLVDEIEQTQKSKKKPNTCTERTMKDGDEFKQTF